MIPPRAIVQESGNPEPTGLPVVGRPIVGSDAVAHHLTSGRGVDELRFCTEAADDLHLREL